MRVHSLHFEQVTAIEAEIETEAHAVPVVLKFRGEPPDDFFIFLRYSFDENSNINELSFFTSIYLVQCFLTFFESCSITSQRLKNTDAR